MVLLKRVALTGASGFTGRFVIGALESRGVTWVPLSADLRDRSALFQEVRENRFDCLIHLAAQAFVGSDDWEKFYNINQLGTFHLLDAVATNKPGIRCIVASSAQVYGSNTGGLIAESSPVFPSNHYAVSKLAMEYGVRLWNNHIELAIVRPFNYTGVGQDIRYLVPKIVDHFRRRAETVELGNLWVKRDFGDVRSVADAYVELALSEKVPDLVNIATGTVYSIDDILRILSEISGHRIEVEVNPAFVRRNDVEVLGGDVSRLCAALPSWKPRDLRDTLAWMLSEDPFKKGANHQ